MAMASVEALFMNPLAVSRRENTFGIMLNFPPSSSSSFRSTSTRLPSIRITPVVAQCYSDGGGPSVDDLKSQLEALQAEAEQARARANTARARFMRLTETVENLRSRAASDVNNGREESARQLIAEKQKIMKALEKSKQRAELLEQFSMKLGEAISMKEVQLIVALSSARLGANDSEKAVTTVRIISPKKDALPSDKDAATQGVDAFMQGGESEEATHNDLDSLLMEEASSVASLGGNDVFSEKEDVGAECSAILSTRPDMFPNFLARIDGQLRPVDAQLQNFVNVASMILPDDFDTSAHEKVAIVKQIWLDVQSARARCALQ